MAVHRGREDRPVVIFIHGLGVDRSFWTDPEETKILARNIPLRLFAAERPLAGPEEKAGGLTFGRVPAKVDNLWRILLQEGFSVLSWSQTRPAGPVAAAVEELDHVLARAEGLFPGRPVALIGHSRGGLIARKSMEHRHPAVRALVTIASPHRGSSLSRLGNRLLPLSSAIQRLLPESARGTVAGVLRNLTELIQGRALQELMPGSDFITGLKDAPSHDVRYLSFGGNKTKMLTLYRWKQAGGRRSAQTLLSFPDSIVGLLPESIVPDELVSGRGDFMVTAESAVLPWPGQHYNLPENHISITWNRTVADHVVQLLQQL
ncbi:MAG: alpha/beta fold hydrolase [Nitrospiraceae bacterium]|nr:MAG: alpha/beta fold hydrolase [Nitrospiraceae bacterium]